MTSFYTGVMSRRAASSGVPVHAQRPAKVIDYVYTANPDYTPRHARVAVLKEAQKHLNDKAHELLELLLEYLPGLITENHDTESFVACFRDVAIYYVHHPNYFLASPSVILPIQWHGKRKVFLPHPALPILLECNVQQVMDYDYAHVEALPYKQQALTPHATLQEFRECHTVAFQPTQTDGPRSEPLSKQPGVEARRQHRGTWIISPTADDPTRVRQTIIVLRATHIHWRLDDTEDERALSEQDVRTTPNGLRMYDPSCMNSNQVVERAETRNSIVYDKPPDDPLAKHHSMIYEEGEPNTARLPAWTTAPVNSPAHKERGTPLLPYTFTIEGRKLPLPALLDDLIYGSISLVFCARAEDFVSQDMLFAQNLHIHDGTSIVDNDHTHLLNPVTGTTIPIKELPPTDLVGIQALPTKEEGRAPRDRFCDVCLQTTRYLRLYRV